jgi:hypothetical protein
MPDTKIKKTNSLVKAYVKGGGRLALWAAGLLGAVFAWRLANEFYDWVMGKKKG